MAGIHHGYLFSESKLGTETGGMKMLWMNILSDATLF